MEATLSGLNLTGVSASPQGTQAMTDAVNELTPPVPIDTGALEAERLLYINESETVGSVPPPVSLTGAITSGMVALRGASPSVFMDKIGERIAFERGSTRLYEALIAKYMAASQLAANVLPPAEEMTEIAEAQGLAVLAPVQGENPAQTLTRIRFEELQHFKMLCAAMQQLGGDPTAQTPCADVIATSSLGLIQVVTDPRTTLAQCLNAMLTAELTDNAGWELLINLAEQAGESELADQFLGALSQEQEHLVSFKGWLTALVSQGAGTPAV